MRLILLVLCLFLGGCGAKPGKIAVRMATVGTGLQTQYLPFTLAQSLGYYSDEGLAVSLETLSSNGKTIQALVGGSVDVASTSYSHLIQLAVEGQRARAFFVGVRRNSNVIVVSPAANARIRRAEDLKGAVIGIPAAGSAAVPFLNFYLAAHGVPPSETSRVAVGVSAAAVAAIESGRVDAAMVAGGDHMRLLRRNPSARILVDGSTPEGMREIFGGDAYASGALSARQEWLDGNPDTARRLARALRRTLEWIGAHTPEEIREKLPDGLRSEDAAVDVAIIRWGLVAYTSDGKMPAGAPEDMKRFFDSMTEKIRDSKIDLAATWTNEFLAEEK